MDNINPIQFAYIRHDGQLMRAIIEPVLENGQNSGIYRLFKDGTDDNSTLITDPKLIRADSAPINENDPDYLGSINIIGSEWEYTGTLLTESEQQQMAAHILQQFAD